MDWLEGKFIWTGWRENLQEAIRRPWVLHGFTICFTSNWGKLSHHPRLCHWKSSGFWGLVTCHICSFHDCFHLGMQLYASTFTVRSLQKHPTPLAIGNLYSCLCNLSLTICIIVWVWIVFGAHSIDFMPWKEVWSRLERYEGLWTRSKKAAKKEQTAPQKLLTPLFPWIPQRAKCKLDISTPKSYSRTCSNSCCLLFPGTHLTIEAVSVSVRPANPPALFLWGDKGQLHQPFDG